MRSSQGECGCAPCRVSGRDVRMSSLPSKPPGRPWDPSDSHSAQRLIPRHRDTPGDVYSRTEASLYEGLAGIARNDDIAPHDELCRDLVREETLARTLARRAHNVRYATSTYPSHERQHGTASMHRSVLEDHAYPVARPSLSVFNAPTATYMWPSFQAASQMSQRPVIYVNYNVPGRSSSVPPRMAASSADEADRPPSEASRKRRYPPDVSSSDPVPVHEIVQPFHDLGLSARSLPDELPSRDPSRPMSAHSSSHSRFSSPGLDRHTDPYGSDSALEYPPSEVSYGHSPSRYAEEGPELLEELGASPRTTSSNEEVSEYDPNRWQEYARPEGQQFRCTWVTIQEGVEATCTYVSRKHLVKRHIQTTHMKIKKWKCNWCGKAFPQKGSLDNHIHTHTGAKPHACRFGCGETFNDPARRHRHMIEKHGYMPRRSTRKRKPEYEVNDLAQYESVHPWRLRDSPEQPAS